MPDLVAMIAGQSNGLQMCSVPVAGCSPVAGCYVFTDTTWRAMTSSDGAGMIELAKALRSSGRYDNVFVYDCSYSGSSIVLEAASPSSNCWQNPYHPIVDCLAQVAAGGRAPQLVVWIQGEAEVQWGGVNPSFDMASVYPIRLGQVRVFLMDQWGTTAAQCTWMITPVGYVSGFNTQPVLQAQQAYANSTPGVFLGPPREDLATLDGIHLAGPSCLTFGDRLAASFIDYLQGLEVMTDPQDKAAIASLQNATADIQAGITNLQAGITSLLASAASLQANVATLQQNVGSLQNRAATIEALTPGLIKWPQAWGTRWQ
jgi:hypothetical protein